MFRKFKLFVCIFSFLSLIICPLSAQEEQIKEENVTESINSDILITKINVSGLTKTKPEYVESILKPYIFVSARDVDIEKIESILHAEGLFSEINVSVSENEGEASLDVSLKEKITFIPLPFFYCSSSDLYGGFFVIDMNAFGAKNMVMAGGMFGNNSGSALFAYVKPPLDLFHPGFSTFLSGGMVDSLIKTVDDEELLEYSGKNFSGSLKFLQYFTPQLSGSIGAGASYMKFDSEYSDIYDDFININGSLGISLSFKDWNGFFLNTSGFNINTEAGYTTSNDFYESCNIAMNYQDTFFIPQLRYNVAVLGALQNDVPVINWNSPSSVASFLMSSGFKSQKMAAAYVSFEGSVLKKESAGYSLFGSYECSVAEDYDNKYILNHGPCFGSCIYLSKIAMPAFSLLGFYNIPKRYSGFSLSIGMNF